MGWARCCVRALGCNADLYLECHYKNNSSGIGNRPLFPTPHYYVTTNVYWLSIETTMFYVDLTKTNTIQYVLDTSMRKHGQNTHDKICKNNQDNKFTENTIQVLSLVEVLVL